MHICASLDSDGHLMTWKDEPLLQRREGKIQASVLTFLGLSAHHDDLSRLNPLLERSETSLSLIEPIVELFDGGVPCAQLAHHLRHLHLKGIKTLNMSIDI